MKNKNWQIKELNKVLKIQNGYAFDSKKFSYSEGMPLIRIRDLKQGIGTEIRYSGKHDERYVVKKGDLLIGMDGEFGCYEWKGENALLNQRVCRLQNFNGINKKLLLYGINKYLKDIEDVTTYTTVKHISSKQIENISFPFPESLSEQHRIVKILDSVFESIAKAKENAERNLENAKKVFNAYLESVDAEKMPLGELVDISTGKLDANAAKEDGQYPFFTCSREIFSIDKFAFDCEAILLAGNNAVGDFNVKYYNGKFNAYQRTYVITVNKNNRILYKYLYYQMLKSLKEFKNKSVGAGTKFLKLGMIKDLQMALPTISEQKSIVKKLDELSAQTKKLEEIYQKKLEVLEELKKSVLQKAFAGEL